MHPKACILLMVDSDSTSVLLTSSWYLHTLPSKVVNLSIWLRKLFCQSQKDKSSLARLPPAAALTCVRGADSISIPRAAMAKRGSLAATVCFGKPLLSWQKLSCRPHKALSSALCL